MNSAREKKHKRGMKDQVGRWCTVLTMWKKFVSFIFQPSQVGCLTVICAAETFAETPGLDASFIAAAQSVLGKNLFY